MWRLWEESQMLGNFRLRGAVCALAVSGLLAGVFGASIDDLAFGEAPASRPAARAIAKTVATPIPSSAQARYHWGRPTARDEFNYSGSPDPRRWMVYEGIGDGGADIWTPAALSVGHGYLTISGTIAGITGGLASKFGTGGVYGRWETRMRTSTRQPGYNPVLILWPDHDASPRCQEIDYAEGYQFPSKVDFFLHHQCRDVADYQTYVLKTLNTTQWHNYAVEVRRTGVTGYIDGKVWFRDTNRAHLPTVPEHAVIQLSRAQSLGALLGSAWMQVDWTRYWRLPN